MVWLMSDQICRMGDDYHDRRKVLIGQVAAEAEILIKSGGNREELLYLLAREIGYDTVREVDSLLRTRGV